MKEFRKSLWTDIAKHLSYASFLPLIYSNIAYASFELQEMVAISELHDVNIEKDTYTINFNNVAITEVIRFASKITHLNFIFDDADLQFNVTVVSEDPLTAKSMLTALIQILRTHDLTLIEQEGNVLITRSTRVSVVAPIIPSYPDDSRMENAALVTRVFQIKNGNVNSLAAIIRPMTSEAALVEVSLETKQLIVTDVATNVEQIAILLESLDIPHALLEVETYVVKHINPDELVVLTQKLLEPFKGQNPLLFVARKETNSIFIVSTPYLNERALTIMEDLDTPSKLKQIGSNQDVFLYHPINRTAIELMQELNQINDRLQGMGQIKSPLAIAIENAEIVKETGSLLFLIEKETKPKLEELLLSLDSTTHVLTKSPQVFVYRPKYLSANQIEEALRGLIPSLKETHTQADKNLIEAIESLKWHKEMQSFIVIADPKTLERFTELFATIDAAPPALKEQPKGFYLYKLQTSHCEEVMNHLKGIAEKLPPTSLQNQNLIAAIEGIDCILSNNSLLITGAPDAIEEVKTLIVEFDGLRENTAEQSFFIYKPHYVPAQDMQSSLSKLLHDLKEAGLHDSSLLQTLSTVYYTPGTDSLVFIGDQETLKKIREFLPQIDNPSSMSAIQHVGGKTFFIYKIQHAPANKLLSSLKTFAEDLKASNAEEKDLATALQNAKWIKETNSILFTGNTPTLEKIDAILKKFDTFSMRGPQLPERAVETFVIYSPKYVPGDELISIFEEFEQNLINSGVSDPTLFDTINNLKWIETTSSLLISGDPKSVTKVQELLEKNFDIPGKAGSSSIESIENTSFLVYKLQYHPGNDIQEGLKQIAINLGKSGKTSSALAEAISSTQWIQVTNSLLCSGQQDILVQLKELIQSIDVPLRQVFIEVLIIQTTLSNIQNFGLMWGAQSQYFTKATMAAGNFPLNNTNPATTPVATFLPTLQAINATTTPSAGIPNRQVPFTNGFDLGVIGDVIMHKGKAFLSLGTLVNALQVDTDTNIVLNPKIIAQDNRQSTIFVGQNIPYTGAIVTNQQQNTTTTQNIEYRDVGMSLTITPILGEGDVVTMDIVNDLSQVTNGSTSTNTLFLSGITTSHTHMETRVQVPDNYFVALSGMINDTKQQLRTGIPCLGGLPVIGALFSENDRTASKGNIIIFVRPKIVNTYEEYKKITEHQEWLYKDNARLPVLKEWFDEGVDLVKVPENE